MRQWGDSRPQVVHFRDNSQPLQPMHVGLLCSLWRHARSSYAVMSLRSPHLAHGNSWRFLPPVQALHTAWKYFLAFFAAWAAPLYHFLARWDVGKY